MPKTNNPEVIYGGIISHNGKRYYFSDAAAALLSKHPEGTQDFLNGLNELTDALQLKFVVRGYTLTPSEFLVTLDNIAFLGISAYTGDLHIYPMLIHPRTDLVVGNRNATRLNFYGSSLTAEDQHILFVGEPIPAEPAPIPEKSSMFVPLLFSAEDFYNFFHTHSDRPWLGWSNLESDDRKPWYRLAGYAHAIYKANPEKPSIELSERKLAQVEHALDYAENHADAGVPGASSFLLIAELAQALDLF